MVKKTSKLANSVTLRLFPGVDESSSSFEVVKVTGNPNSIDIDALVDPQNASPSPSSKEIETFDGYFPEDGYDYAQHLREINQDRFIPATRAVEDKGIEAKSQDLAEVIAAMDECAEGESEGIDMDFIKKLGPVDERTRLSMIWGEDQVEEYIKMPTDRLLSIQNKLQEQESRALRSLDADKEFEAFFAKEFEDSRIGSLTAQDVDNEDERDILSESNEDEMEDPELIRKECSEHTKRLVAANESLQMSVTDANDDLSDVVIVPVSNVPEWDCESVLSTRSNMFNHPGLICRPKRDTKPRPDTINEENTDETECIQTPVREVSTFRKKGETSEERKERKRAVKEFQREQREGKKSEQLKQKQALNKQRMQIAFNKHINYGDIPSGVAKFAF
jgi:hypothetical protein